MADPTCLALCAGIGGLELGVHAATGCRVVGYVERDAYAASVLLARMEDAALAPAPVWCGNLEELGTSPFQGVDIITAGFPCQPFSVAGKRKRLEDDRWLWPAIARIIGECEPSFVFLENVPGVLVHGAGSVLHDLAALGFDAQWDMFSAAGVGAPHRRERWFCLGYANSTRCNWGEIQGAKGETREEARMPVLGSRSEVVADATMRTARDSGGGRETSGMVADGRGDGLEGQLASWAAAGTTLRGRRDFHFPWPPGPGELDRWADVPADAQPALRRVADGLPSRMDRLRCLGNAVVPEQAELAFRTLYQRMTP